MAERNIVDVGKFLQQYGWNVGENPAFGSGRVGVHAPGSYHYSGKAIDVTVPQGQDVAPAFAGGKPIPWKQRTGELSWRAKQLGLFQEALGPGDKGHDTHVHLALPDKKQFTDQQLQWLATGRYKTPEGKLTDVMPGAQQQLPPQQQQQQQADLTTPGITYNIYVKQPAQDQQVTPKQLLADFIQKRMSAPQNFSPNDIYSALTAAATNPNIDLADLS